MSLFGSLFSGVSGLTAQSQAMGMISDNVSNVNTVSYKGAAPKFSTLVTRSAAVSTYSPGGARANTSYRIDQQGLLQGSNSPTDVGDRRRRLLRRQQPPRWHRRPAVYPGRQLRAGLPRQSAQ